MTKKLNVKSTQKNFVDKVFSGYYDNETIVASEINNHNDDYDIISGDEMILALYGEENAVWEDE